MADRRGSVAVLPRWSGAGRRHSPRSDDLRATVGQLDELAFHLAQVSPCLSWSAQRWMIASTPFRMRRIGARKRLNDLAGISSASDRNTFRWAFELDNACLEAGRRLRELDVCLYTLHSVESSAAERVRATEEFAYSQSMLLKLLRGDPALNRFTFLGAIKMIQRIDVVSHITANQNDFRGKLDEETRKIDERLKFMVEAYQEKPSVIDHHVLEGDNRGSDIEAMITEVYQIMRRQAYSDDCALKADTEIWEAFNEQRDEFTYFYMTALKAIETYKKVMEVHNLMNRSGKRWPKRGDLGRIRHDQDVRIAERYRCIDAVRDFRHKFSAMLTFLLLLGPLALALEVGFRAYRFRSPPLTSNEPNPVANQL
jgi:uncharacterized protein YfkK (UPF0435 family)